MTHLVNAGERQLTLDFNATSARSESLTSNKTTVVSFDTFARSRQIVVQSSPALDRLLREAKKLHW